MNVPNLPVGQIVTENGYPTDSELTFRQNLVTGLQNNIGQEGFVLPTQTLANMTLIQNNTMPDPSDPISNIYTCGFGTMLYLSDQNKFVIAMNNGSGEPVFMEVSLVPLA